jgi:methyl-accepting chemotaxis protein
MNASLRSRQLGSTVAIGLVSIASGLCVLAISVLLQWLIYDDWMHRTGPLQIVGSLLTAALATFVVLRWQIGIRRRREEMLRRFRSIERMNDRIRNSLQTIDLLAFVNSRATEQVRSAVDSIAAVLREVLEENHPEAASSPLPAPQPEPGALEVER